MDCLAHGNVQYIHGLVMKVIIKVQQGHYKHGSLMTIINIATLIHDYIPTI